MSGFFIVPATSGESCRQVGNSFRGIHILNLDSKGRVAIPACHRADLGDERLVATIAIDNRCLWLYPWHQWQALERQLLALPSLNRRSRRLQRLLIGHAQEGELDGQGRFLLSTPLRKYANLTKSVALVGVGTKFEIWDEEAWDVRRNVWMEEESLEDLAASPDLNDLQL